MTTFGNLGRERPILAKMGAGASPTEPEFFSGTSQWLIFPNLVTKCSSVSRHGIRKDVFENFHFRGHLPQKSDIEVRSNKTPHPEQATGHGMYCREILFTPRCSPRVREFPR